MFVIFIGDLGACSNSFLKFIIYLYERKMNRCYSYFSIESSKNNSITIVHYFTTNHSLEKMR